MKVIGIDIGQSGVRIAELLKVRNQVNILKLREISYNLSPDRDREIAWIEASQVIQKEFDLRNSKVVVGLPLEIFSTRAKFFPFADRYKIAKTLPFELEDELPPTEDEMIVDFRGLISRGNEFMVVGLASSADKILAQKIKLESVNLRYDILSCEGIALSNLCSYRGMGEFASAEKTTSTGLEIASESVTNAQIFIQIGHTKTLVHVLHSDGQLLAARQINWGTEQVIKKISTTYEIPQVDAVKEFEEKAFILLNTQVATYDQVVFSNLISGEYEVLGRELNLLRIELEDELQIQFSSVNLCGGGGLVTHLGPFMTQVLQLPCELIELRGGLIQGVSSEQQCKFAAAIGIALEAYRPAKSPALQFLKGKLAQSKNELPRLWKNWGVAIQASAILLAGFFLWSSVKLAWSEAYLLQVEDQLKKTATSLAGLPPNQARPDRIQRFVSTERARLRTVRNLQQSLDLPSPLKILQEFSQISPGRTDFPIEIRSLSLRSNNLRVEGVLTQEKDRSVLEQILKQLSKGNQVQISPGAGVRDAGRSPFIAQVELKRF